MRPGPPDASIESPILSNSHILQRAAQAHPAQPQIPQIALKPVNTTRVDGVAVENRARQGRGPQRQVFVAGVGGRGPQRQVFVAGVRSRARRLWWLQGRKREQSMARSSPHPGLPAHGLCGLGWKPKDGVNFPHFVFSRRWQTPGIHPTDKDPSAGTPVCVAPLSWNREKSGTGKDWLPSPPPW